jgi:hypothetical protein
MGHGYDSGVQASRGRWIDHAEIEALCEALLASGAWQTMMRVRVAQSEAVSADPDATGFRMRPAPEDEAVLSEQLEVLRTHLDESNGAAS